jgi:hypothetical protein
MGYIGYWKAYLAELLNDSRGRLQPVNPSVRPSWNQTSPFSNGGSYFPRAPLKKATGQALRVAARRNAESEPIRFSTRSGKRMPFPSPGSFEVSWGLAHERGVGRPLMRSTGAGNAIQC